ncbi:hypothetical protein HYV57_02520 [Candidatus Peregrinibacteria bacterium]|nr:hypothetical protein [Candidatus Peregrinibacteria bacterium]
MTHASSVKRKISITILPSLDDLLALYSSNSGESKSSLIEKALSEFIKEKLDKDSRALSKLNFDDLPSEDDWIMLQSEIA